MTAVAVAILDRDGWDANTDVIVVADDRRRRLTWVPRDLFVPSLRDRINQAFARGGGELLMRCLAESGFPCTGLICLRRSATEAAFAGVAVTVPVRERLDFWYPLEPQKPIEEGRKQVSFVPPEERLTGERLHQWVGARTMVGRAGSDLFRCDRQQVLLRSLLAQDFDFNRVLAEPSRRLVSGVDPLPILAKVSTGWTMTTFRRVRDATIDGRAVLAPVGRLRWALRGVIARANRKGRRMAAPL